MQSVDGVVRQPIEYSHHCTEVVHTVEMLERVGRGTYSDDIIVVSIGGLYVCIHLPHRSG